MTGPPVRGTLAFAAHGGVIFSSGFIEGKVTVSGPVSQDAITLSIGFRFGPNARPWLNNVSEGDIGVVLPGDEYDAFYTNSSLYIAATVSAPRLEEEAKRAGLVFNRVMTSRTGLHPHPIAGRSLAVLRRSLAVLRREVTSIHRNGAAAGGRSDVGCAVLRTVIEHYAQLPVGANGRVHPVGCATVVSRALDYIREHLAAPLTLDAVAEAVGTSRRTFYRISLRF